MTPGADTIAFNLAPSGATHTLTRSTALPAITEAVTINGYTQPGSPANTVPFGAIDSSSVQVRLVFDDGTTEVPPQPLTLAARSRTTLSLGTTFPNTSNRTFCVIVESRGASPAPIVAELSTYSNTTDTGSNSLIWGAGTNVVATRVR